VHFKTLAEEKKIIKIMIESYQQGYSLAIQYQQREAVDMKVLA
jgi:hypothetical protein